MTTEETRALGHLIRGIFDPQFSTLNNDEDATADKKSGAVFVRGTNLTLWGKQTGATIGVTPATVKLQGCNFESTTDSDWVDLADSQITFTANDQAYGAALIACGYAWVRTKFDKNSNTGAGTFKTILNINR